MKFCAENCCLSWKNINLIRLLIRSFYFGNGSYRWFGLPRLPESQQRHQKAIVLDQKRESREFEGQFLFCCLDSGAKSDVSKIEIFRVHFWAFRRLECIEMDRKLHFSSPNSLKTKKTHFLGRKMINFCSEKSKIKTSELNASRPIDGIRVFHGCKRFSR